MGDESGTKKRKKSYYINSAKKKRFSLDAGMRGFLITCNNREKEAVKEAYNLLNEYADKLYGPEQKKEEADDSGEEVDIEDALKKEVNALQAETSGDRQRRFQVVDSGAKNCVFIKTTVDNPCELAHAIFSDIAETGEQKSRFILKFIPISATCKATEEALTKMADPFLETHFGYADKGRTFGILFKSRNNNQIGRNMVFNVFGKIVSDMHPGNKVNLNDSEETIIVDVLRKVCCVSVLKDFFKFRKYNLFEVAKNHVTSDQSDIKSDNVNVKASIDSEQVEKDETELDKPEGQSVTTEETASCKKADDEEADATNKETTQEDQHVETKEEK